MDDALPLVITLIVGVMAIVMIWLVSRVKSAGERLDNLSRSVAALEEKIFHWQLHNAPRREPPPEGATQKTALAPEPIPTRPQSAPQSAQAIAETVIARTRNLVSPPPLPSYHPETPRQTDAPAPPPQIQPQLKPATPAFNWEQFMGVKGFAWVGGLALFLGIAFFVKYSFDNNLVPPELRVAIGFFAGLALLGGGVVMSRRNLAALSQTLCATGVVVLYAVTFACHAFYHFKLFGAVPTFALMAIITVVAIVLAARLEALVVAILGMLGGFLTPVLLSTGQDNPAALFVYIAILDAGLIFLALERRWHFLAAAAALGTVAMQGGWVATFFERERYFEGNKVLIALAVLLGFNALYVAGNWWSKRRGQFNWWFAGGNLALAAMALPFTLYCFSFPSLADRPILLFSFVFLMDAMVTMLGWLDEKAVRASPVAGLAVFILMVAWTTQYLTANLLNPALVFYFIFAVFHSALPIWLQKQQRGKSGVMGGVNLLFPPLALLLVLIPILQLQEPSFFVWPFVLIVDLLAVALAVMSATLLPVLVVLALTLAATGELLFKVPADLTGLPMPLWMLAAFAVFFSCSSVWLLRKFKPESLQSGLNFPNELAGPELTAALLPISSVILPYLLLIMVTVRLPSINAPPIFGLTLLLVALSLGLTLIFRMGGLAVAALAGSFAVECAWQFNHFGISSHTLISPAGLLGWYVLFFAVFAAFPFLWMKRFADGFASWTASALAGPAQFLLIYRLAKVAWPGMTMGILPIAFAMPALLCLVLALKNVPSSGKPRQSQLAWYGGVALLFITLIFPIQFEHQWITLGWALEGAALLWLFHRVPHPGLRLTGIGLLLVAFVRLALNRAVLDYHVRSATPIFNWYLYTYGIVTAAFYTGTWLLAPPRHMISQTNARALLGSLGTVLAFLLLNIEIADFFSAPGSTLTFEFSGNFARDMTYSIAWALFALGLLVFGIGKGARLARYAAMGLLCGTLVKLFLHDLAQLGQLYRIGAFVGVAVIAMLASFAYQRFFSAAAKPEGSTDKTAI